jgi:hypothetical protein
VSDDEDEKPVVKAKGSKKPVVQVESDDDDEPKPVQKKSVPKTQNKGK